MALNRTLAPRRSFGRAAQSQPQPSRRDAPTVAPSPAVPPPVARTITPPVTPAPSATPAAFGTFDIAWRSFALMRRNSITLLALVAAAAAPNRILYHLLGEDDSSFLLDLTVTALTCVPLYAAVFAATWSDLQGEKIGFGGAIAAALHALKSSAAVIALTVVSVWCLLIVPFLGLATHWAVAAPAALAEDLDLRTSLARSTDLTAPCRSRVRTLVLLLALLAFLRGFEMLPVWGLPLAALSVFMVGNWLFPLLLTAFTAAAGAALYAQLRGAPAIRT
jgi:hypothetical protein